MLDEEELRAEVEAKRARMQSEAWARDDGKADEDWMGSVVTDGVIDAPRRETVWPSSDSPDPEILPRLDALSRAVAALTEAVVRRPVGGEGVPGWLQTAAGNPLTYDAPDPARTSVCVRILPTTYARLQQAQARLGLRTTAGAWECLLRLGLAAAERLPAQ